MKKKIIPLVVLLSFIGLNAQVTVTTITDPFKGSGGLSLDTDGNLYIADFGDFLSAGDGDGQPNDISKLDQGLQLSQYSTNFVGASGNAFDSKGILHQSDIGVSAIYKVIDGVRTFFTSTGISNPVGLTFDSDDNMYVCNCGNNTIRKVSPTGVSTLFSSGVLFACPNGITVDENDNLYVSNFSNGNIIKIDSNGNASLINVTPGGTTSGPSNGHLDYHQGLNTLFIASHASSTIYYINLDNPDDLEILAGTGVRGNDDGDALDATFSRPNGVAVTQSGDSVYINSSVPLTNIPNRPLNPSLVRLITGVQSLLSNNDNNEISYEVKTYPNPVKNNFTIETKLTIESDDLTIKLYNIQGKLLNEITNLSTENFKLKVLIDISNYTSGTYFYSVFYKEKQLINDKIIKL